MYNTYVWPWPEDFMKGVWCAAQVGRAAEDALDSRLVFPGLSLRIGEPPCGDAYHVTADVVTRQVFQEVGTVPGLRRIGTRRVYTQSNLFTTWQHSFCFIGSWEFTYNRTSPQHGHSQFALAHGGELCSKVLQNTHQRHPIARPWGELCSKMFIWVHSLILSPHLSLCALWCWNRPC